MRGVIGRRLSNPNGYFNLASIVKQTPFLIQSTSHFSSSSSSSSGRGRGRGGGDGPGQFGFNREPEPVNQGRDSLESPGGYGFGHGRGRGLPIQSDPIPSHSIGRGRGSIVSEPPQPQSQQPRFPPQQRFEQQQQRFQPQHQEQRFEPQQQQPLFPPQQPEQRFQPQHQEQRFEPQQQQQQRFQPQQQDQRFQPQHQEQRFEPQQQHFQPQHQQQQHFEPQQQQHFHPQQQQQHFQPQHQQRFESQQQRFEPQQQQRSQSPLQPQAPVFEKLQEIKEATSSPESSPGQTNPPKTIFNALGSEFTHPGSGAGRGKPPVGPAPIRHPQPPPPPPRAQPPRNESQSPPKQPRLSAEEAGRRARSMLSRDEPEGGGRGGRGGGRGRGGRGMRGRGRGGRGGDAWRDDKKGEEAEKEAISIFVGDSADGEKFAKKIGPEMMSEFAEAFEESCEKALPTEYQEDLIDAYDINFSIECEPEYLMPDFGSNPDIDEKPPMSLRECIEKVKPFIVAYEGIKDQEEWEEAVNKVMEHAPLIKEMVDHYSGPDRVSAKKQSEELNRITTALPQTAPDSVKRFADRASLILKSNPGWGYNKKYQFMDKLVKEVSQNYK